MNSKNYEIAKDLKRRLSKFVLLIDFRFLGPEVGVDEDEIENISSSESAIIRKFMDEGIRI